MKKIYIAIILLVSVLFLTGCTKSTKEYAATYSLESYEATITDEALGFTLIRQYDLELDKKSMSFHTYSIGKMEEGTIEEMKVPFKVERENNKIIFTHTIDMFQSYRDIWEYYGDQIVIRDIEVAIVDRPDPKNQDHYAKATIYLKKN